MQYELIYYLYYIIDYKLNEINDQQEVMNNAQGWNAISSHDIMVPVPIKMQPSLGILDHNNLQMNNIPMNNIPMNNLPMNNIQMNNLPPINSLPPMNNLPPISNLQMNNISMNNSSPHPSVIHTSPQTPHVSIE